MVVSGTRPFIVSQAVVTFADFRVYVRVASDRQRRPRAPFFYFTSSSISLTPCCCAPMEPAATVY